MIHPPFSFCGGKKRTGGGAVQEKKRLARNLRVCASSLKCGGCSSGLPPKLESPTGARRDPSLESVSPALTPRRSTLEVEVKPALQAPADAALERKRKSAQGVSGSSKPPPAPRRASGPLPRIGFPRAYTPAVNVGGRRKARPPSPADATLERKRKSAQGVSQTSKPTRNPRRGHKLS